MFNGLRKYILPLALVYFISPIDLLPFMPLDDLLVAGIALSTYFMTSNRSPQQKRANQNGFNDEEDVITTSWSVVDDEPKEE